jgi:hypothetical protein
VSQIALHPVAGMDQPFTAPRLMAILMSSVREATPEVIGLAGVVVVPPMRGYLRHGTGRPQMGLIFSAMARPQFRELITRLRVFARDFFGTDRDQRERNEQSPFEWDGHSRDEIGKGQTWTSFRHVH